jgi:dienelactone hydrolase
MKRQVWFLVGRPMQGGRWFDMRESTENALAAAFEIGQHPLIARDAQPATDRGTVVEHLTFTNRDGEAVRGIFIRPAGAAAVPAIICIHAHGDRHDIGLRELLEGRPALVSPPGPDFVRAGFAALMIELPGFGTRAEPGESARTKARLWHGGSLAGQMIGELHAAFEWLLARPDVDAARIGVYGLSMGATLGYWLAAVEPRIAALVHLCCYADFSSLIDSDAHDLHGHYLTIPGLLNIASNGTIAGLVAPRPQLICIGDRDPLTPPEAVDIALAETRAAYADRPDRLVVHRDSQTGHQETPAMREQVLRFFAEHLTRKPRQD